MSILKAGFVASLPAVCGFAGGLLGGLVSDQLLRRGHSLSVSRKGPIIAGLLLSTTIVLCNYVRSEALVVALMAIAFLGKGFGALGWAVVSDTSPRQIAGLSGALFNTFGNLASITTPIVVGYIIEATGSYNKIQALLELLAPYGIRELVQSGSVALGRGVRAITDRSKYDKTPKSERV